MAGSSSGTTVTIDLGVQLRLIESSLRDAQNALKMLKPDSKSFKELQRILAVITQQMNKIEAQSKSPISSTKQLTQIDREFAKINESIASFQTALSHVDFSDLELDPGTAKRFQELTEQIAASQKKYEDLKQAQAEALGKNADVQALVPDSKVVQKGYDALAQAIEDGATKTEAELRAAEKALNTSKKKIDIGKRIYSITGNDGKNRLPQVEKQKITDAIPELDRFISTDKNGAMRFRSGTPYGGGKSFGPGEAKQQLIQYLKELYSLNDAEVTKLTEETAKSTSTQFLAKLEEEIGKGVKSEIFGRSLRGFKKASSDIGQQTTDYEEAKSRNEQAQRARDALNTSGSIIDASSETTREEIEHLKIEIEDLKAKLTQAAQANTQMQNSLNDMGDAAKKGQQDLEKTNNELERTKTVASAFDRIKQGIINFTGFHQVMRMVGSAVREAMNHIKQLDSTMNGIAIVTNMTTADLWDQVGVYSDIARQYGVSIQGAYEVSKIYYQAGYETNEVMTLMNETLKLSKISGLDYATTTDYMMTAMRGFKLEMEDASHVVDVYSGLAANTAVSQKELAEAMTRTASSMESVGATFEETSAMIATMVAVTRESASNIGSAMKSIGSRFGELTKDPTALLDAEGEAMSFNKVDKALRSVGITLQTTDHQFRDFTDVILELADKWDTLDSAQQRYIATQFAGNRLVLLAFSRAA